MSLTEPRTRVTARSQVLNALAKVLPELVGGSADLTGSNLTNLKVSGERNQFSNFRDLRALFLLKSCCNVSVDLVLLLLHMIAL